MIKNEIDLLVDWAVNEYGSIQHFLKNGWLQLDDYNLFIKQMKDIHYNNFHGHHSEEIEVRFNHHSDNKVHFEIKPFKEKIISYNRFSISVWYYLKNYNTDTHDEFEQLTLF